MPYHRDCLLYAATRLCQKFVAGSNQIIRFPHAGTVYSAETLVKQPRVGQQYELFRQVFDLSLWSY